MEMALRAEAFHGRRPEGSIGDAMCRDNEIGRGHHMANNGRQRGVQ